VPLSSRARAAITELLACDTPDDASISYRWKRAIRLAGIEGLTMHDCRHEAVSRLFEKGLTTEEVMQVSGHRTYSQLARYTHLRANGLIAKLG
jgi:integrase